MMIIVKAIAIAVLFVIANYALDTLEETINISKDPEAAWNL